MYQLSQRTGVSVPELDELKKAAAESGVGFEAVSSAIRRLSRSLGDLRTSGRDSNESLDVLNLTMTDLQGLSFADQFELIGSRIAALGDHSQQTSTTMSLMGRSADELIPIFRNLGEARERAREGRLMSPEDAARAFDLSVAFEKLDRAYKALSRGIGSALSPAFTPVLKILTEAQKAIGDWVRQNESLVQAIGWTVAGLGVAASGIASFVSAVMIAKVLIGGLSASFVALGSVAAAAWAVVTSPVTIIAAALAGLAFVAFDLGSTFREVGALISETWGGVVDAFKSGDLALAGRIGLAGLKLAWVEFKNWFMNVWEDLPGAIGRVWDRILSFFGSAIDWLKGRWQAFLDWLTGSGSGAAEPMPSIQRSPAEQRQDEIAAARQELTDLLDQARQQREETDNALRRRLDNADGPAATATQGGTRGTFNASAAFGLVGGRNPVVEAVQQQTSIQREQLRRQQQIEENTRQGARFQ